MAAENGWTPGSDTSRKAARGATLRLALALGALAALGAGIAVQQALQRRLTKPEKARLKFYRYLRERGHLES